MGDESIRIVLKNLGYLAMTGMRKQNFVTWHIGAVLRQSQNGLWLQTIALRGASADVGDTVPGKMVLVPNQGFKSLVRRGRILGNSRPNSLVAVAAEFSEAR